VAALHHTGRKLMQNLHKIGAVAHELSLIGPQSHIICARVAASCMQIVPAWPPVTEIGLRLAVPLNVANIWRPMVELPGYQPPSTSGSSSESLLTTFTLVSSS
jgi:hypothetical protein